jgi:8-oxo-dGTP pyrophosphatase MutT (NUDIX family)
MSYKQPISTLVVIYTSALEVLLLDRADHPGYWQSVTGSRDDGEPLNHTAARETFEETGLVADRYKLPYLAPPLCSGCDTKHRACIRAGIARGAAGKDFSARTLGLSLAAMAGSRSKSFFSYQPRDDIAIA